MLIMNKMEEVYLHSCLRVKRQMAPIRETFPKSVHTWEESPSPYFRYSYNYLVKPPAVYQRRGKKEVPEPEQPGQFVTPHKSLTSSARKNLQASAQTEAETIKTPQASDIDFLQEIAALKNRLSKLENKTED